MRTRAILTNFCVVLALIVSSHAWGQRHDGEQGPDVSASGRERQDRQAVLEKMEPRLVSELDARERGVPSPSQTRIIIQLKTNALDLRFDATGPDRASAVKDTSPA